MTHSTLEVVLRPTEPVAAVYLGAAPDVANEYQLAWETRWRPLAARLREQGADEETVRALETALAAPAAARAARGSGQVAGFAREGKALAVVTLPGLSSPDLAEYGAPAHMLPLLRWAQERPAYVLVVIDRTGADIAASIGAGSEPVYSEVEGPDDEIAHNAPGGFKAAPHHSPATGRGHGDPYRRRAEDSWAHNAAAVAEAAAFALQRVEGRILVVSGDVRAQQLLLERLPEWVKQGVRIMRINGSRGPDGSQKSRTELVARAVREATEEELAALWQTFLEERSPHGLSVEGAHETLAALSGGRVGTLIVSSDLGADDLVAWFGPAATEVLPVGEHHPVLPDARKGRLVDVSVRAALLTGAQVRVIPPGADYWPMEGVGGICRYH
jgi:hypothetical protein